MSVSRPNRRVLVTASGTLAALIAASPASAVQSKTLDFMCKYPLVGAKKHTIKIDLDTPDSIEAGVQSPEYQVTATAQAYDLAIAFDVVEGLTGIVGTSDASSSVVTAAGNVIPVPVKADVPKTIFEQPIPNPIVLVATVRV